MAEQAPRSGARSEAEPSEDRKGSTSGSALLQQPLGLFQAYGIEIEYAIVDAATLDVRPLADALIEAECGEVAGDAVRGAMTWSNELARHVIELKTSEPEPTLRGLASRFAAEVRHIESLLAPHGARLMPSGMHPWMDPAREFALWPHGDRAIYEAFDRIFDCRGHGWANLQSMHLNLPFDGDAEFGALHAASRALLPLLPALSASSPFQEGRHEGLLDARLEVYRWNAARVPSVTGAVVPEPVFTRAGYQALLEGIYADLAPLDPEGTLREEWVNARGCIARFDRSAIEIRVLDAQECPSADLAIAAAVSAVLRALCAEPRHAALRALDTRRLAGVLHETIRRGEAARIEAPELLGALGLPSAACTAREAWARLIERHVAGDALHAEHLPNLGLLLEEGCLARRILDRVGSSPSRHALRDAYAELCDCLRDNRMFRAKG
jgi:gamma-glutamyl:cysteine ligase YbdK (ATP-grasp superfamily)